MLKARGYIMFDFRMGIIICRISYAIDDLELIADDLIKMQSFLFSAATITNKIYYHLIQTSFAIHLQGNIFNNEFFISSKVGNLGQDEKDKYLGIPIGVKLLNLVTLNVVTAKCCQQ